jgi:flagellar biosynthesis/type III secretory pathway chaperone
MNQDARHRLEDLLDREIETARLLSDALAAERAALTGNTPDIVPEAAAEKVRLLGTLETLEVERRALWNPSPTAASGIAATVLERWRALMELMAGCRTANEVNGRILHIRQNQIRQLIDIVRGGVPMTYGPQGKTFAKALRALARA